MYSPSSLRHITPLLPSTPRPLIYASQVIYAYHFVELYQVYSPLRISTISLSRDQQRQLDSASSGRTMSYDMSDKSNIRRSSLGLIFFHLWVTLATKGCDLPIISHFCLDAASLPLGGDFTPRPRRWTAVCTLGRCDSQSISHVQAESERTCA